MCLTALSRGWRYGAANPANWAASRTLLRTSSSGAPASRQGDEDAVVPPSQTEAMVEALRRRGIPVGYFLFSGEQHGFRKAANIQRALDAELYFYAAEVFEIGLRF